jgi:hypothetical protein
MPWAPDAIPNRFLFLWSGRSFPYHARLAVESALLADPHAEVEIHLFGDSRGSAPAPTHLRAVQRYARVRVLDVDVDDAFAGLDRPPAAFRDLLSRIPRRAASARSNLLRYGLLHRRGGVYLDLDVLVLRSLRALLREQAFIGEERVFSVDEHRVAGRLAPWMFAPTLAYLGARASRRLEVALGRRHSPLERLAKRLDGAWQATGLNNAVLGGRPRARFLERVLAAALDVDPTVRFSLGPTLVTRVARHDGSDVTVLGPELFYAEAPSNSFRFFAGPAVAPPAEAAVVHYVQSNHRRLLAGLDEGSLVSGPRAPLFHQLASAVAARARALPVV